MTRDPTPLELISSVCDESLDRRTPKAPCLKCGKVLDLANTPDGSSPSPGDLSVCLYCANVMRYGDDLQFVPLAPADYAALPREFREQIEAAQAVIRSMPGKARRGRA